MPIYEYRCSSCGFQKEYLQKVTDPVLSRCPECGLESFRKMLTAAGFQLKGSGWYVTDFKGDAKQGGAKSKDSPEQPKAKSEAATPAGSTGASGTSSTAESEG